MNVFNWLEEITVKKSPASKFSQENWDDWNSYMVHRFLSMNMGYIDVVNVAQEFHPTDKKGIYNFYKDILPKKKILNKTYTSIELTYLIVMLFHIIMCMFKMTQDYFQNGYISFNLNNFILMGNGHIFNAYFILKNYIDIGLDKIKKISKPNEIEHINYNPKLQL